jgi:hypothetical protein
MAKSDAARAREHRLAAKLRENLKRRKAVAPGEDGGGEPRPARQPEPPAPAEPGRGKRES